MKMMSDGITFMQKYLSDYPKLVEEFHPIKNGGLKPKGFTYGSAKKYGGSVSQIKNMNGNQELQVEIMVMDVLFVQVNKK